MPEVSYPDALFGWLRRCRAGAILCILAVVILLAPPKAERYGDRLQVALPALAMMCEIANGSGLEYLGRLIVLQAGISGAKAAFDGMPISQRPNGKGEGFPSGHTAAAVFGAASLVDSCLKHHAVARMVVIGAAGFVGASRIDAEKHTIWQVVSGAIWGVGCNCALRANTCVRRGVRSGLLRVRSMLWGGICVASRALWRGRHHGVYAFVQSAAWATAMLSRAAQSGQRQAAAGWIKGRSLIGR